MSLWFGSSAPSLIFLHSLKAASCREMKGGGKLLKTYNHSIGVDCTVPLITRSALFISTSTIFVWQLFIQTGEQYCAIDKTMACVVIFSVLAEQPHDVPASFCTMFTLGLIFDLTDSMFRRYVKDLSRYTPRYFGLLSCLTSSPSNFNFRCRLACRLLRWNTQDVVFSTFGLSLQFLKYLSSSWRSFSRVFSISSKDVDWNAIAMSSA